jgi:DHA3 family macrolide efflux protein-like MFS transporter
VILFSAVLGLLFGLAGGGKFSRLLDVRLRWSVLIFVALALRMATEIAITNGIALADQLRLPLYAMAFGLLVVTVWANRAQPGLRVVAVGAAANGVALIANGGWMPVWGPSLAAAGLSVGDLNAAFHRLLPLTIDADFFMHAGPLGDLLPLPIPFLPNVVSPGDVFIAAGLGLFVFVTLVRGSDEPAVAPAYASVAAPSVGLDIGRPTFLGSERGPSQPPAAVLTSIGARVHGHPYVRLALDARFAAFWLAQAVSLFGDRLHQVALGVLVYAVTESPLATGLVFLAATLPNILLGPIAGTFVDRWEHRTTLIASDLIRAALVVVLPFAALANILYVYPIVFLITTVSLFFRPAKVALVPRIVPERDLLAANSATWTADTLADIAGFPLAGLLVAFLGAAGLAANGLALAFLLDAVTYLLSALLVAGIVVPPLARSAVPRVTGALRTFAAELGAGWRFLRRTPALFQNTLISAASMSSIGVTLALTVVYARDALDGRFIAYPESYAAIETALGVGNLVGGLAVGAIGARFRKGWLVVIGFVVMGLATVLLGLTSNVLIALAAAAGIGVANLVWLVPTQTIFIERTPVGILGRVVAFRGAFVYGSMTLAMAAAGLLAESYAVGPVIAAFGVVTTVAGAIGALLPAVRDPAAVSEPVEPAPNPSALT